MERNVESFNSFYKDIRTSINDYINNYNASLMENKNGYLKDNLELFTNLNSDGKLIRGFLIALGYKMLKNDIEYSYNLALAYELFQTSVLIHDDIIDNDNLRRGKETIHYANYLKYRNMNQAGAKKVSESIAICMGDYGFFEANKLILNYIDNPNYYRLFNYYNDIVLKTIEGELTDVVLSFDGRYNLSNTNIEENVKLVYKLKTAFYTIIGPLTLGLLLGGIEESELDVIANFGEKVGVAFQIQDDILGIYSDMGKVVGSDIKEFKQTILFSYVSNNKKYLNELLDYYGKEELTENDINETRRIFKESGAFSYATTLMNKLYDESITIIDSILWIKEEDKEIIKGFVEYLRGRGK